MKIRDVNDLPVVKLGETDLTGKVLVSPDDHVGFSVFGVRLGAGESVRLTAFREGENHIYYCISGKCVVNQGGTEMHLSTDHMLALTADAEATGRVLEPTRLMVVSVPRDPDACPPRHCLKNLQQILNSERNVDWGKGYSRRFLAAKDGFNISLHNTVAAPNNTNALQYRHHVEANYVIKGEGCAYKWDGGQKSHALVTDGGTLYLLDQHDPHEVCIGAHELQALCVFFPALQGHETHKSAGDGSYSSY